MSALGPLPDIHAHEHKVTAEELAESDAALREAVFQEGLGERKARARKTFDIADADDSGLLSMDELPTIVRGMGLHLSDEELHRYVKKLFKELDSDGSGTLDFDEFWYFYSRVLENEKTRRKHVKKVEARALSHREKAEAKQVFTLYDRDKSGTIDVNELHHIIEQLLPVKLTPVEFDSLAEDVLKRGDKDHDGTISFSEFSKFYSACLGSSEKKEHYVEKLEKRYGRAMGLTDDEIFG